MVIIKATCPTCGEVDLVGDQVKLHIGIDEEPDWYSFDCPRCLEVIRKPADARVVQLLLSGGVGFVEPASDNQGGPAGDAGHPSGGAMGDRLSGPRPAPAITYDDLLDWHRELEAGVLENFLRSAAA